MARYLNSKFQSLNPKIGRDFLELAEGDEGYLFPDTYFVPQDMGGAALVRMMRENFDRRFAEKLRVDAAAAGLTVGEVVILASVVEREVKFDKDRPVVAGILLKRYKNDWPLEADATVQYAISTAKFRMQGAKLEEADFWPKKITKEDLGIDSLYNTRKYAGLPPAPICNPGLEALEAVVYPRESPYWYYVSDGEGRMHYARSLEEHLENVSAHL